MRVVLDTNVLVRATANARGPARELFLKLLEPSHTLVVSDFLLEELHRVLSYPRVQAALGLSAEQVGRHLRNVAAGGEFMNLPAWFQPIVQHDPDDDAIVATAVYWRAEVLSTLDEHLRRTEVIEYCQRFQIRILTDVELLEELRRLGGEAGE